MFLRCWVLTFTLVTTVSATSDSTLSCPDVCRCSFDNQGRQRTLCESGGLTDLIPVAQINTDTQILIVTGNEYLPNNLSLGPIFKGLKNLEEIHLAWSGIPTLGEHSFWGLMNLKVLNLTHNYLTNLVDTNFKGAIALRCLDLSYNTIESVPSAVFRHVKNLRTLSLANNIIPELVPRIFFGLTRLKELDISYNPFGDLQPELFSDVPVLEKFSCAGCGLLSISSSLLKMLPELVELNLQDNRLTHIPHTINILQELRVLRLDGNHISFIEKHSLYGSQVSRLHLSNNNIVRVEPDAFLNSSVTYLDLSYNSITTLDPKGFEGVIARIYDLRLSGNSLRVESLINVLPHADKLRRLSLGDIGLTAMPASLMHYTYFLEYLNVSANYLSFLPLDLFQSSPNLVELDLSLNSFRGLSEDVVDALDSAKTLRKISLDKNPWYCDQCHGEPLIRWLQNSPDQESSCNDSRLWTCLTCASPRTLFGVSLALLPHGDLPPCKEENDVSLKESPSQGRSIIPASFLDDSSEPLSHSTLSTTGRSIKAVFVEQLPFIIIGLCSLVAIVLLLSIGAVIAYSRHSAHYYTREKEFENKCYFVSTGTLASPNLKNGNCVDSKSSNNGTVFGNGTTSLGFRSFNKNNNTRIPDRPTASGVVGVESLGPSIATIEELADIAGSTELVDDSSALEGFQITDITILESEPKPGTG